MSRKASIIILASMLVLTTLSACTDSGDTPARHDAGLQVSDVATTGDLARLDSSESLPDGAGDGAIPDDQSVPSDQSVPRLPPYRIETEDLTWNDAARARDVPARIFAPAQGETDGPLPLVVFSHGGGESRESYTYLGNYWAQSGYIAIFVTHLGFDRDAARNGGDGPPAGFINDDIEQRPRDLSFAIDRATSEDPGSRLIDGRVDSARIATGGQCAGASTALMLAGLAVDLVGAPDTRFVDSRVRAVVALSPQVGAGDGPLSGIFDAPSWERVEKPTLAITGSRDFAWLEEVRSDPLVRRRPYDRLVQVTDKFLVDIKDAEHHAFTDSRPRYPVRRPRDPRHHDWIAQAATRFLDAQLKQSSEARDWLTTKQLQRKTGGECYQESGLEKNPYKPAIGAYGSRSVDVWVQDTEQTHGRSIDVRITFPTTGQDAVPLILLSHASGADHHDYTALVTYWVSHGYVVIQPEHLRPDAGGDWSLRPPDMSFLIDQLDQIESRVADLAGRIDHDRIGAAGHYIGAGTANLLVGTRVYSPRFRNPSEFADPRVRLSIAMSPTGVDGHVLKEQSWEQVVSPMLVLTGSEDPSVRTGNPPQWRTEPYVYAAEGAKYLVWIDGLDSQYGGLPAGTGATPIASYIKMSTLAFLDAQLKNDENAETYLSSVQLRAYSNGRVTVDHK
jgi:predicted dienelactone hydrolase